MAQTTAAAQPGAGVDPYLAANFELLINGISNGRFIRVSGIGVEVEPIFYREAGNNAVMRSVPGRKTCHPVRLDYGVTSSREAWDWLTTAVTGNVNRRNVSIVLLDAAGSTAVLRWNLFNAWPYRCVIEDMDAMSQRILVSSLTLTYEGLELEASGGGAAAAG